MRMSISRDKMGVLVTPQQKKATVEACYLMLKQFLQQRLGTCVTKEDFESIVRSTCAFIEPDYVLHILRRLKEEGLHVLETGRMEKGEELLEVAETEKENSPNIFHFMVIRSPGIVKIKTEKTGFSTTSSPQMSLSCEPLHNTPSEPIDVELQEENENGQEGNSADDSPPAPVLFGPPDVIHMNNSGNERNVVEEGGRRKRSSGRKVVVLPVRRSARIANNRPRRSTRLAQKARIDFKKFY